MKKYFKALQKTALFRDTDEDTLASMLTCLAAKLITYQKNEVILLAGDDVSKVGIVVDGAAQVVKEDIMGGRVILAEITDGELFAETFACAGIPNSPVTVLAVKECAVVFIELRKIIITCSSACPFHVRLIENMLRILAEKNLQLNSKLDILSKKTIGERLMAYFSLQIKKSGSQTFDIPFSRDELADYLCVNRSAMSRELGKMRGMGVLTFRKNTFTIHTDEPADR